MLRTAGLAIALLFAHPAGLVHAQSNSSTEARQHGYEHGYRDGADRGRQDRERGLGRNFRDNDYLAGARDYDPAFGNRSTYMSGYQQGYTAGYDDGYSYYDRPGQYGQLYGRQGGNSSRGGEAPPATRQSAGRSPDAAFDAGYREGISAGQQDRQQNARSDYRRSPAYRNGSTPRSSSGEETVPAGFQDGFERGYQDGYGGLDTRQTAAATQSGHDGCADTRDGAGTTSRTLVIPATRQWTPTSISVHQGDRIHIETTGEIRWTANAAERARAAGSLDLKKTPGAPMPNAFAGALIGRIDSGRPFGIGDQTSLVAPASGLLYLGINGDNVGDNGGQFQVVISW